MSVFHARAQRHAALSGNTSTKRHRLIAASIAVAAGLAISPIVSAVTAGTASASGPVITAVGGMANAAGDNTTTVAVSPQNAGDLLVLVVKAASTSVSVSSVSGGGVGSWTRAEGPYTGYSAHDLEIWTGTVSTTGSSTITVTFSTSVTSIYTGLAAQEFSGSGSGTVFAVATAGGIANTSSTTVTFPSLTPSGTGELYFGYAVPANTGSNGSTSGFTYTTTTDGDVAAYDTDVTGTVQPTASQNTAGISGGVAVLITASNSSPAPTVTGVSTSSGSTAGGTSVTITGMNFTGATGVSFGATAASGFSVNSATSITATSPSEPAWQTDITVTGPGGTSATGAADKFTFEAHTPVTTGTPHVMVIMMENESYSDLIGNSEAPNFNQLAQDYGLATQSYAIGHPSEPNYLEMISGSNWGVTADNTPQEDNLSASDSTIANQLEAAGIPWRAYFENMPSNGYTGADTGGEDGYGNMYYFQHHNPFVYFPAVTALSDFDTNVVPLSTNFGSDLYSATPPDYVWVTPNAIDDMHDGPELPDGDTVPTVGDAWLGNFIGGVQATPWYAAGGQIVIEFDEGLDSDTTGVGTAGEGGGGHIPTIVVSAALAADPQQDATPVNTAGILHSIEQLYGLPYLEDAANSGNGNLNGLITQSPPTVTGVSPNTSLIGGGTSVTITGAHFTSATGVSFGGEPATTFSPNSDTSITATAPAEAAGSVNVTVTGPGGTSAATSADTFTYFGVPTVAAVSPNIGPSSGGTSVTVTGTNLSGASAVDFGASGGTNIAVHNGGSSLTVTAPPGAVGTVNVTVTNPAGTSAISSAGQFTYQSSGYWMAGSDGSVFSFGAPFEGSLPGLGVHVNNIVAVVPTSTGKGYWMIGSDGGVFAFGDAGFVGSLPGIGVHVDDIVGAVPTSTGKGYWMVGKDGGVFAFGDAGFVGSLPGLGVHVNNIVAVVPTSTGKGYWMIGSDGGVFAFGDAGFVGSLPGIGVHVDDIVGAVPTSTGKGYWMVGKDGGVFAFGDAGFVGSLPGLGVHVSDVTGVVSTVDNQGYWMVGKDGGVFAFGDAGFVGSLPGLGIHVDNIVAFARQ